MESGVPPLYGVENAKEHEPSYKVEVVFFENNLQTAEDLLLALTELEKNAGDKAAIVLDEYQLKTDDVIENAQKISHMVMDKGYDLVMAPDSQNVSENQSTSWGKRAEQFQQHSIQFEPDTVDGERQFETMGFFFGKDGLIYAFPKMWERKSVHSIPGRDIGVTICGEIHSIKPEEVKNLNVIYNPSRERDDPYISYRMAGLLNPNISQEDIIELLYKNEPGQRFALDEEYWKAAELDEEEKEYFSRENRERRFNEKVEMLLSEAKNAKADSMYMRKLKKDFPDMNIPIIRADSNCSGIVNPGESTRLKSIEQKNGYSKWSFEFQR